MSQKTSTKHFFPFSSMQPSVAQQCLLNCCLTDNKETFIENWKIWKTRQDFELLDYESLKLIPVLNGQILRYQINDNNQPRYQGIYKKCWVNTTQLFSELPFILNKFQEATIPFKIIKNIAFNKMYYHDNGLLQTFGADIFIKSNDLEPAINVLLQNGYIFNNDVTTKISAMNHSVLFKQIGFKNQTNHQFVLHTHPFKLIRNKQVENLLFENGLSIKLDDEITVPTLNHTQHLFYTVINGVSEKPRAMLQWALDFKTIIHSETIHWDEFIVYVKQFKVALLTTYALNYLSKACLLDIPEWVLNELSAIKPDKEESLEFNNFIRKNKSDKLRYSLLACKQLNNTNKFNGGYLDYIKLLLKVETVFEIPKKMLGKLLK